MTTLPNLALVLPTTGSDTGTWGDKLNTIFGLVDAHDHTSGKGVRIPSAALNINADVSFGSAYAPTNLHRATFASITALSLSAHNKSLFVSSADNELYWRNNTGTNVKLTSGTALNVAAFAGAIGGDYTSVSAALNYDNSGVRYTLKGAGGSIWARMASGEVRIFETSSTDSVYVGHAAPAALAASYTVTWPLAVPAATHPIQMTSAGVLTETGSIAMASNENITLSGTGEIKHGDRTLVIMGTAAVVATGTATYTTTDYSVATTAAATLAWSVPVKTGDRIKSVTFAMSGNGTVDGSAFVDVVSAGGALTGIGTSTLTNVAAGFADRTVSFTSHTMAAGEGLGFSVTSNAAALSINNIRVVYDRP